MTTPKYDISKSFKLSNENITNVIFLQKVKGFKNDSEAVRFCIDYVTSLVKSGQDMVAIAKLLEATANGPTNN